MLYKSTEVLVVRVSILGFHKNNKSLLRNIFLATNMTLK